jgi:hypothetical protein
VTWFFRVSIEPEFLFGSRDSIPISALPARAVPRRAGDRSRDIACMKVSVITSRLLIDANHGAVDCWAQKMGEKKVNTVPMRL